MGAQWKNKGRTEAASARGRVFSKLAKEIAIAAKSGADPGMNARLRMVLDSAKKASMPKDTIDRAIKKGAGLLDDGAQYETVMYEGFGPHRVPVIVECLTDNKNRTSTNIRILFRRGLLGSAGSVAWDFRHLGLIEATPEAGAEDAESAAIEAGAQEVEPGEEGATRFITEPTDLDLVSKALTAHHWHVSSATLGWRAKNPVKLEGDDRTQVEAFLETLDADDDVQSIFVGLE